MLKLNILSLNVDGLLGKLQDNDFILFLNSFDIVCLQETFMTNDSLPPHMFSSFTKFFAPAHKLSTQGRCSGGVMLLIKSSLGIQCQRIEERSDNTIVVKLLFKQPQNSQKDILLVTAYVPPNGSPYYDRKSPYEKNGINILEDLVSYLKDNHSDCSVILCGDLNSRTDNAQPICESCDINRYTDGAHTLPYSNSDHNALHARHSEDTYTNCFGNSLVSLCTIFDFCILNGTGSSASSGLFTFVSPHGNSVVDYFIVSHDIMNNELKMHVLNRTESWHMPITLEITLNVFAHKERSNLEVRQAEKIVWDESKLEQFMSELTSEDSKQCFSECIHLLDVDAEDSLKRFNDTLMNATSCMKHTFSYRPNPGYMKRTWFDTECYVMKKAVRKCLHTYRNKRSEDAKQDYIENRRMYKKLLTAKRKAYSRLKTQTLLEKINDTVSFWREVKSVCSQQKVNNTIAPIQWYNHFKRIFQQSKPKPPVLFEDFPVITSNPDDDHIMEGDITTEEIMESLKTAKNSKSPGPDNILNEMLKTSQTVILPYLTKLYQYLFNHGVFPSVWSKSVIVPIYKKGNPELCDNYRPISLTSLVSKLYTNVINKRLTLFLDSNNKIAQEQAGYRDGFSTIDHIFTLYAMIQKQFSKDRKLYAAFVDYRKCFDSIHRDALFHVIQRNGVSGKLLNAIKAIYKNVLACVRVDSETTEPFLCPIGLKQGCLCSPKLFSLFINDLSQALNLHGKHGIQLTPGSESIFHLLFADDALLVSDTVTGLQNQLNVLSEQSDRLGLEVNLEKTQIIVFRKGGFLSQHEKWTYHGEKLEVVNSYKYLGADFSTRMSFATITQAFVSKAKKACYEILTSLRSIHCYDLNVFLKLFDAKVKPILLYGSELWGMNELYDIEKVHMFALKRFLNVSLHCSNAVVYGETGRYPLHICHKIRSLKFWIRLQRLPSGRISRQAYQMLLALHEKGKHNWATDIRNLLCMHGFGIVWFSHEVGCERSFLQCLRLRLVDCYKQDWYAKLCNSTHHTWYNSFKSLIQPERYLSKPFVIKPFRDVLVKFRMSVSALYCHKYKYSTNTMSRIMCPVCNDGAETELHFLFMCKAYEEIRNNILPRKYLKIRNLNTMSILLSKECEMFHVAKYLFKAFELRKTYASE